MIFISSVQLTNDELNVITGFHLFDDEQHLFVLEGRKEDAIDILYQQLPKPEGQSRFFCLFRDTKAILFFFIRRGNSLRFFNTF